MKAVIYSAAFIVIIQTKTNHSPMQHISLQGIAIIKLLVILQI